MRNMIDQGSNVQASNLAKLFWQESQSNAALADSFGKLEMKKASSVFAPDT